MGTSEYDIPELIFSRRPGPAERYVVREDYHYPLLTGATLTIKAGYEFDGGSIPRLFWRVAHPAEMIASFAVHDAMYSAETFPRSIADYYLYRNVLREGGSKFQAAVIYAAVRACGWLVWRRHTDASVRLAKAYVIIF